MRMNQPQILKSEKCSEARQEWGAKGLFFHDYPGFTLFCEARERKLCGWLVCDGHFNEIYWM